MELGTRTRKRLRPEERRELIELEARRLFGRHGYAATRLEDVASAAGITKPMVYRHFASKKDLYQTLLRRHERDLSTFIGPDALAVESPAAAIEAILGPWLDYADENSDSWLIIFRDKTGDAEIERARVSVNRRATEVLAAFLREMSPDLDPELVEPTADFLRTGLAGLILWWIDHPSVPKKVVQTTATRACLAVLGR
ncbi:MAG: TetR/AcrR family transcriptional regulator [Actinomycetota bacterium]|nr:TetR/AcrR family transcriptional regulator [Actinomycetota bacterium]